MAFSQFLVMNKILYRSVNKKKLSKSCFLFLSPSAPHQLHGLCLTKTGILFFFYNDSWVLHIHIFSCPKSVGKPLEIIKYPKNLEQNDNHRVLTSFPRWLKRGWRERKPGRRGDKNSEERWLQSLFLEGVGWENERELRGLPPTCSHRGGISKYTRL